MTSSSPVATARPSSIRLRTTRRPVTRSSPSISTGERRNLKLMRRSLVPGGRSAYERRISTLRRLVGSSGSSTPSSSAGSTCTSTPVISPSSRSSGFVNAACSGPRRPSRITSDTLASDSGPIAWSAVSVSASSPGSSSSMRATSIATLPLPITTARSALRSKLSSQASGWPLYQATKRVAGYEPGRSSPGIPSRRSVSVPTA